MKLRPIARRLTPDGRELPSIDDDWMLRAVQDGLAELENLRTGHLLRLGYDNIREFRTPNFLLLRCQITLKGNSALIEPLVGR